MGMWTRLWSGWKTFAEKVGAFQSRILLLLLYFLVVSPFALLVKIWKDPLREKKPDGSNWVERTIHRFDLEASREQF